MMGKHREDYFMAQDVIVSLETDVIPKLMKLGFVAHNGYLGQIRELIESLRAIQIKVSDDWDERGS